MPKNKLTKWEQWAQDREERAAAARDPHKRFVPLGVIIDGEVDCGVSCINPQLDVRNNSEERTLIADYDGRC